jgi:hypothetical protein
MYSGDVRYVKMLVVKARLNKPKRRGQRDLVEELSKEMECVWVEKGRKEQSGDGIKYPAEAERSHPHVRTPRYPIWKRRGAFNPLWEALRSTPFPIGRS